MERLCSHHQPFRHARLLAAALFATVATSVSAQTLFHVSERVKPGEPFSLTGADLGSVNAIHMTPVLADGTLGTKTVCSIIGANDAVLLAKAPALASGVWKVSVQSATKTSNSLLVNAPRIVLMDDDSCAAGDPVTVYGRNLTSIGSSSPSAYFVASNGGRFKATVVSASPYRLTMTTPAGLAVGQSFKVVLSNGDAGSVGEAIAPTTISIRATGTDPFSLGVPWGREFLAASKNVYNIKTDSRLTLKAVGNGVTDDTMAVQLAINAAYKAGGGMVYLPEGTYLLDGEMQKGYRSPIDLYPGVVLSGVSTTGTIVTFGKKFTPTKAPAGGFWLTLHEPGNNGVRNMTIRNLNSNSSPNYTITHGRHPTQTKNAFLRSVNIELGNGRPMDLGETRNMLIQNCQISSTNATNSPVTLFSSERAVVEKSRFTYRGGRIDLNFSEDCMFIGNVVNRDMNYATVGAPETGGVQTSFARRLVVADNTIAGIGPASKKTGDGEMIMSQRSVVADFETVGTVTLATADTLTDSNSHWAETPWQSASWSSSNRIYVAIVKGRGMGQWRMVESVDGKTIHLDAPWDVIPDVGSTYTVSSLTNYQQFILNNRITNGLSGISIYDGAIDSVVNGNTVQDAGFVGIRTAFQEVSRDGQLLIRHEVGWYNELSENTVANRATLVPATISISAVLGTNYGLGNAMLANDVRSNLVQSWSQLVYPAFMGSRDGYWNQSVVMYGGSYPDANLGSVFSGNKATFLLPFYRKGCFFDSNYL